MKKDDITKIADGFEKWLSTVDIKAPITPQSEVEKNNGVPQDYGAIQPWQFAVLIEYGSIQPWTISWSKEQTLKLSTFSEEALASMGCSIVQFIPKVVGGKNPPICNNKREKEML